MGYIAVKGGSEAIASAAKYFEYCRLQGSSAPVSADQIQEQLHLAVDRVMGEGALYAPQLAALALKQSAGDTLEAAFMVRAYRTTQPRMGYSLPIKTGHMRVVRRISAAFKEIPGGQILGPTPDYTLRLLDFALIDESVEARQAALEEIFANLTNQPPIPDALPKVIEILRRENLLVGPSPGEVRTEKPADLTRHSLKLPAERSAALQAMAMGETGGMLALAYSNMRGFGSTHPTVGELRVGYLPVAIENPQRDTPEIIGEVKATEAEVICSLETGSQGPRFTLGYGLCFGHNETKAIAMAVLDRAMQSELPQSPSEDQEFVLMHIDGVESMGFCNHFKLPHYVTFQSALDRLRKSREAHGLS
ncbi:MAG: carbon-phosphorus lyase complex subunit PhnI [Desulfobacterales bacterium]